MEQPVHFGGMVRNRTVAPPMLGEHTAHVLKSIQGMSEDRIEELNDRGVIRTK